MICQKIDGLIYRHAAVKIILAPEDHQHPGQKVFEIDQTHSGGRLTPLKNYPVSFGSLLTPPKKPKAIAFEA